VPLELVVNLWPVVGPMTPLVACLDFPTPTYEFNLRDKDAEAIAAEVLAGNDPDDFIIKYYPSQANAEADRSPLPYIYTNVDTPADPNKQRIWVRVENKKTGCFNIASFWLRIETAAYAYKPSNTEFCETDYVNDGISLIDLTVLDPEIIGNQSQTTTAVRYERWDETPIPDPTSVQVYQGEVLRAIVYRIDPEFLCTDSVTFTVHLKDAPVVQPLEDGIVCYEYRNSGELITGHYLDTGVAADLDYTFSWTRNGLAITTNDADVLDGGRRIYVKRAGTYSVTVTGTNGCSTSRSAEVQDAPSITIDEVKLTDSFGDTNAIEVIAYAGAGVLLEYKLDNGNWQDSNIFLDVTPGEHTVYVRVKDALSCEASKVITVMDYPKYFTPNNDGYNDTWNIWSLKNQPDAKIYIFDRFGKLIKQ